MAITIDNTWASPSADEDLPDDMGMPAMAGNDSVRKTEVEVDDPQSQSQSQSQNGSGQGQSKAFPRD